MEIFKDSFDCEEISNWGLGMGLGTIFLTFLYFFEQCCPCRDARQPLTNVAVQRESRDQNITFLKFKDVF